MKKLVLVLTSCLLLVVLTACDAFSRNSSSPLTPIPDQVPGEPRFTDADDLLTALRKGGIDCEVLRRRQGQARSGSSLDCVAEVNGVRFENEVSVFNPEIVEEGEIGRSIASRRKPPGGHTLVAAGNWYIRVLEPGYAPRIAEALDAVVLPPLYPLPDIPAEPRYADLDALADALDSSVGCTRREEPFPGGMRCRTEPPGKVCAQLELHDGPAARDDALRRTISRARGMPLFIVTAGNWSVQFCEPGAGRTAARDLGAAVVSHDGE